MAQSTETNPTSAQVIGALEAARSEDGHKIGLATLCLMLKDKNSWAKHDLEKSIHDASPQTPMPARLSPAFTTKLRTRLGSQSSVSSLKYRMAGPCLKPISRSWSHRSSNRGIA
ncbi:hypothetical protein J7T55_005025 [Diaporthe amygdali]|uniref:uncharacterized protein n=1 Tax=Phomopsis amygdali TaxID=1214568 RepID=UPI0022FDD611|nr:uncharacterized protein J7T55_005025 [Diaporthe amygdali]KAJ0116079.1 hypothetical protein J7T55_005025 [Diaporthe amygdali]